MGFHSKSIVVEPEGFREALHSWLIGCQAIRDSYLYKNYPDYMETSRYEFEEREGGRYIKIFLNEFSRSTGEQFGGSIHAFIDKTNGDVLKPDGVKAPAKKARANLFDHSNGTACMGPYGVLNAR